MIRLPENELELEMLVRERTEELNQYLAAIVQSSDDAIISKDLDGIITSWNKGAERLFGYTSEEVIGKSITILIPPDRQAEAPIVLDRIKRGQRVEHYETIRQHKHGELIDISLTVSPVRNSQGAIIGASKIGRDISERKRREAQMLMMAREAEHRARNMLSIVLATVKLSRADTADGLKLAIEGRIQALANVAELFASSHWNGADLHTLVTKELSPFCQPAPAQCRIEGPPVVLEPHAAEALALTLHELATNAVKYGALSTQDGFVQVEWSRAENNHVVLRWSETGCTQVQRPKRQGFGTELMQAMIVGQLRGTIRFDWRAEGLACEIAIAGADSGSSLDAQNA
jgi:PAS domain S-box-containing protein